LRSDMVHLLQGSVSDGTYRYCNEHQCPHVLSLRPHEKAPGEQHVKNIRLAIDDSCNLRCPSCRTKMIFHTEGSRYRTGIALANSINDWLQTVEHDLMVHIGSDGDPFASHVYRHFMTNTPVKPNLNYSLLTNGLMFKEFHTKIPHVMQNLSKLGVSIDGATKQTYEQLRLGGKWDKIMEALECMSELKKKNNFYFALHMVVQQDNWHEMEIMLGLAESLGADRMYFNKIEDWNTNVDMSKQTFQEDRRFKDLIYKVSTNPITVNNVANLI
jgi:MoaA/NifB/PqqE/SkfB family radical SAM enzyme